MGVVHYFVDEAGDMTLFNKRGALIVGQPGVSRTFMVGVAAVADPAAISSAFGQLRSSLLQDPYFRGCPSMQPDAGKTALAFHACKDLPEVRREVFRVLPGLGCKVHVAIRRKATLAIEAKALRSRGHGLTDNNIYDALVSRLFRDMLHKADEVHITFARRGKADRDAALREAIERARAAFRRKWGIDSRSLIHIRSAHPSEAAPLQLIDYYLWAVQRLFEAGEDRFFASVASQYRRIMDLDDTRHRPYGEWYTDSNPLVLEKVKPVTG